MKKYHFLFISLIFIACNQAFQTPIEKNNFKHFTKSKELKTFIYDISKKSEHIRIIDSTLTTNSKLIYLLNLNYDLELSEKLKVLIFAQQHGNEHSGKEAVLMFLNEIANNGFPEYLRNLNLFIIPQMNPDGSDDDLRRNGNGKDLNRDHLVLHEAESRFLKYQFNRFLPEAILDIHEYYPFSKSWLDYKYLKNFDVQFGTTTNPNIFENILKISKNDFIPFIEKYLIEKKITHNQYIVGGPPNVKRMRYSTTDINDGRQSTGIYNSFSFILEGKNGKDSNDQLMRRSTTQLEAIKGWLNFLNTNFNEIKKNVRSGRSKLLKLKQDSVIVRQEHYGTNTNKILTLYSIATGKDTIVSINNFHDQVKSTLKVESPKAYLIPKEDTKIVEWLKLQFIKYEPYSPNKKDVVYNYNILSIGNSNDEELDNKFVKVSKKEIDSLNSEDYYIVPTEQLARNLLIIALEPQSMFGLVQYEEFSHLLSDKYFPVLRLEY